MRPPQGVPPGVTPSNPPTIPITVIVGIILVSRVHSLYMVSLLLKRQQLDLHPGWVLHPLETPSSALILFDLKEKKEKKRKALCPSLFD